MSAQLSGSPSNQSDKLTEILKSLKYAAELSLEDSTSMPPEAFTSEALLELEREKLFSKEWVCVGREQELQSTGAYFTTDVNRVPVIITRNYDNNLNALVNVCRHRMTRLADGEGTTRVLTCPYHSWAYDLGGNLVNAPKMEDKQFDRSKCRLQQLRVETWLGFIFVNLDADAEPLAPRLSPLTKQLENYHIERMVPTSKKVDVWKSNWKVLVENFLEVYHIESVHRDTLFALGGAESARPGYHSDDYNFYLFAPNDDDNYDAGELVKPGVLVENTDLTEFELRHSPIGCVYPNLLIAVSWFGGAYIVAQPLSSGEIRVELGNFGPITGIEFNSKESEEYAVAKLNNYATDVEDRAIVESIYASAVSGYGKAGPLHVKHEETIHNFIRYLAKKLG